MSKRTGWFYRMMMGFIGLFDRWLHLSCRSFTRMASEKHERPLSKGERFRQAIHRLMCRMCRIHERRMDRMHLLVREMANDPDHPPHEELSPEARKRIIEAMREATVGQDGPINQTT